MHTHGLVCDGKNRGNQQTPAAEETTYPSHLCTWSGRQLSSAVLSCVQLAAGAEGGGGISPLVHLLPLLPPSRRTCLRGCGRVNPLSQTAFAPYHLSLPSPTSQSSIHPSIHPSIQQARQPNTASQTQPAKHSQTQPPRRAPRGTSLTP